MFAGAGLQPVSIIYSTRSSICSPSACRMTDKIGSPNQEQEVKKMLMKNSKILVLVKAKPAKNILLAKAKPSKSEPASPSAL